MARDLFLALLSSLFIGWSIVIGTVVGKVLHPLAFIAVVNGIAFLALLPAAARGGAVRATVRAREFLLVLLFRGLLGMLLFMSGLSLTTGIRASFIPLLEPAFVLLLAWPCRGERIRGVEGLLVGVLFLGSALFVSNGSLEAGALALGDLLILGGLLFYSLSYYPASSLSGKGNVATVMALVNGISAAVFFALAWPVLGGIMLLGAEGLFLLGAFILTGPLAGIFLWYRALGSVRPWAVASLLSLEALSGAALSFFWLGQVLSPLQLGAAALMLASGWAVSRKARPPE